MINPKDLTTQNVLVEAAENENREQFAHAWLERVTRLVVRNANANMLQPCSLVKPLTPAANCGLSWQRR